MKTFRDSIRSIGSPTLFRGEELSIPFVQRSSDKIVYEGRSENFRSDRNYDQIANSILVALEAGQRLESRQLADSVWCLWATTPALAAYSSTLQLLLKQIETLAKPRIIRALAASFLQSFRPDLPGLAIVSDFLTQHVHIARAPYDTLQSRFRIFQIDAGQKILGQEAMAHNTSIPELFGELGLGSATAMGGYAAFCTGQSLQESEGIKAPSGAQQLKLVRELSENSNGNVVFDTTKPDIANALLRPFASQEILKTDKDRILDHLTKIIGDPRLYPARWAPMLEAKSIALRWYTEQSLRQFLDIVDRVADKRMWRYRRKFWESVHSKGMIDSAWVVFDASGADLAKLTFGKQIRFGRFDGTVQKGHAVLLLSIGGSLVAEWSHNGRCHIWNDGNQGPKMYQRHYAPGNLRASFNGNLNTPSMFSQVHDGSENYSWQGKVANRIHSITGVRIRPVDYRV